MLAPSRGPALFWRLAIGNAAVLAAACTITALVFSPKAEDVAVRELSIFAGGLALMLAINLLLLRRALAPLRQLTAFARQIDPLEPGNRLDVGGGDSDAAELAAAFNEMLERLEAERRDSVARALAAQEGERLRVAQELHDGVGQSLTGVVLQLGRAARDMPEPNRERVLEAQETARDSLEEVRRIARMLRPEALDDLGLASALHVLGERVAEHSELEVDVHVQPGPARVRRRRRARALPRRPGGADQRRPPRRRAPRRRSSSRSRAAARGSRSTTTATGFPRQRRRGRRRARDARARGADRRLAAARDESARRRPCHPRPPRMSQLLHTRILLADDHAVVRRGLRLVLEGEPDLRVVAEAGDGAEAVERGMDPDVDLAVLDISMPRMTGLQAARELTSRRDGPARADPEHARQRAVPVRGAAGGRVGLRAQERRRPRPRRGLPRHDARRAVPVPGRGARR